MILLLLVVLAGVCGLWWGNIAIKTTRFRITGKHVPPGFDNFVMVQISDLHNARFGQNQQRLLNAIAAIAPDLVAVTGDLVDSRRTDFETAMEFIHGAVAIAPVYYVTGNHEARITAYPVLEQKLTAAGVTVLRNQAATLSRGQDSLSVFGLDDPSFAARDSRGQAGAADHALKALSAEGTGYTVLLSHRPELFDVYAAHGADLILSGHVHGGQLRLPFIGGLFAPNQGFFPKYQAGVYTQGKTKMVVSRGLGNSLAPLRVNNRPQLVAITLETSK